MRKALEKQSATEVRDAIERARAYAAEKGVPLTAERIAAELGVPVTVLRRYLREDYTPPKRSEAVIQALRDTAVETVAALSPHARRCRNFGVRADILGAAAIGGLTMRVRMAGDVK